MTEDRNRSASLRRALDVLFAVAHGCERGAPHTITGLAAATDINRSTIFRLLQPLIDARLIDYDDTTGTYCLGPQTAHLGQIYLAHSDVHELAEPVLRQLVDKTQETAHLGIRDGLDVVYVNKVESPLSVRTVSRVGSRQPLYCTAMGKVLLAFAGAEALDEACARGLEARTAHTICEAPVLGQTLQAVRAEGYAVDDQENENDIRCVAAPVIDHLGTVIAAISVSGPSSRMTIERIHDLSALVKESAAEVSRKLAAPESALHEAGLLAEGTARAR